jgi:hypothetical protein
MVSQSFKRRLNMPRLSAHKRWVVLQMLYRDLLAELNGHFSRMGVRYMPIKGAYLILAGLAERIDARQMVDVDILVDHANFDRVRDYFVACPNATVEDDPWYFERQVTYRSGNHRFLVEIHYLLNRPERFHLPPQELFERGLQKGKLLWLPCAEDALAIAVCHSLVHIGWGHFREEAFSDFEVISDTPAFSWERFDAIITAAGVSRFRHLIFLLFALKKGRRLPGGERRVALWMRLLAKIYVLWYGRLPVPLQRLLFEIPFVRSPWRLIRAANRYSPG